jgi:hypothetical protein
VVGAEERTRDGGAALLVQAVSGASRGDEFRSARIKEDSKP